MIGHSYPNSIYQQEVEYDMPHDRGSGSTVERRTPSHELDCLGSSSSLLAGQLVPRDTIKEPCSELLLIRARRERVCKLRSLVSGFVQLSEAVHPSAPCPFRDAMMAQCYPLGTHI
jgi:hypothetical protein